VRKAIRSILLAALASSAVPCLASDWRHFVTSGEAPDRTAYYVDAETVDREGHIVRFWTLSYYETPGTRGVNRTTSYEEADCRNRSSVMVAGAFYVDEDAIARFEDRQERVYYEPESAFYNAIGRLCSGRYLSTVVDPRAHARALFAR